LQNSLCGENTVVSPQSSDVRRQSSGLICVLTLIGCFSDHTSMEVNTKNEQKG